MFLNFFTELRTAKVPVSLREYLSLLDALDQDLADKKSGGFLLPGARLPGEGRAPFRQVRPGLRAAFSRASRLLARASRRRNPRRMVAKLAERYLSEEEKREIEALRLGQAVRDAQEAAGGAEGPSSGRQQVDRHRRHLALRRHGYNPEGIRIGQEKNRNFRAVKVWDKREFKDLDDSVELGIRNMQGGASPAAALRARRARSRNSISTGRSTRRRTRASSTCALRPERRNAVKVLLFLDVGGSMDWHIQIAEELFSAARLEFKHFEHFYFHNCIYEKVWKDNRAAVRPRPSRPST